MMMNKIPEHLLKKVVVDVGLRVWILNYNRMTINNP